MFSGFGGRKAAKERNTRRSGRRLVVPSPPHGPLLLFSGTNTWPLWHRGLQPITALTLHCHSGLSKAICGGEHLCYQCKYAPLCFCQLACLGKGNYFSPVDFNFGKFNFGEWSIFLRVNLFLWYLKIWTNKIDQSYARESLTRWFKCMPEVLRVNRIVWWQKKEPL